MRIVYNRQGQFLRSFIDGKTRRETERRASAAPRGPRRVAGQRYTGLVNILRKVTNTAFSTSHRAPSNLTRHQPHSCTTDAGARAALKTVCQKLFARERSCGNKTALCAPLASGGAARRAQNGLVELPDAMSDCLRQFGCLKQSLLRCFQHTSAIVRPAWLQTSIWSTRSMVLARRMWLQNDGLRRGIYDAGTRTVVWHRLFIGSHEKTPWHCP